MTNSYSFDRWLPSEAPPCGWHSKCKEPFYSSAASSCFLSMWFGAASSCMSFGGSARIILFSKWAASFLLGEFMTTAKGFFFSWRTLGTFLCCTIMLFFWQAWGWITSLLLFYFRMLLPMRYDWTRLSLTLRTVSDSLSNSFSLAASTVVELQ